MHPGPGVDGPGPGVIPPMAPVPAMPMMVKSQLAFISPEGMQVQWSQFQPGMFDSEVLVAPGRYSFIQGAVYRLKLANIPDHPGLELYPTIEVAPTLPRTAAFIAHSAIPVQFTPEDFDQVLSGNFVTKVIYLPDPEYQELAIAGVETLVSTRLDPGVDPIVEADRRGSILAIIRLGNKDIEIPGGGEEGLEMGGGGGGYCPPGMMGPGMGAGMMGPNGQVAGPQWGMPITGTPIGLPGPPHIPLGVPAGLQRHTMKNHTHYHLPQPTERMHISVQENPGYHYPKPVDHIRVTEGGK